VYIFYNGEKKIIYIGKSINLKSRVNSYFNEKNKLNFAKKKMITEIKDIETILTNNETESLILESTLIKKHLPKYNILMKDDKNYLYIKITKEKIPKIITTRIKNYN
jgi:excinuclease ABC subunit C